jgi:hypothetical protein
MRAVIALVLLVGCGQEPAKSSGAHAGSATVEGGTTKKSDELLGELIADDTKWKRAETTFGTAELPDGGGWTVTPGLLEHTDGSMVLLQTVEGIEPSAIAEYTATWLANNQNEGLKYEPGKPTFGTVKGNQAARIEGTFDNGEQFKTRAYIVITPTGRVAIVYGRTPIASPPTRLAAIVDHIVATVQLK